MKEIKSQTGEGNFLKFPSLFFFDDFEINKEKGEIK
jgi:hypothetical protein